MKAIAVAALVLIATPAFAQDVAATYKVTVSASSLDPKLPVTDADISDRPYRVVGTIQTGVRKATVFSKAASKQKIYKELWERAERMGADAVILATAGESHITVTSWGSTMATGKAIKWIAQGEAIEPTVPAEDPPAAPSNE